MEAGLDRVIAIGGCILTSSGTCRPDHGMEKEILSPYFTFLDSSMKVRTIAIILFADFFTQWS